MRVFSGGGDKKVLRDGNFQSPEKAPGEIIMEQQFRQVFRGTNKYDDKFGGSYNFFTCITEMANSISESINSTAILIQLFVFRKHLFYFLDFYYIVFRLNSNY